MAGRLDEAAGGLHVEPSVTELLETAEATTDRSKEIFRLTRDPETYEVTVESDVTLEDYQRITRPEDWQLLLDFARPLQGKRVVFLNPTMEGGGVAMLRPPLVHMLKQLGVEAHWFVMEPIKDTAAGDPFVFTKQMHNISQRRTDERIAPEGKALHQQWCDENAEVLNQQPAIQTADILVCDDPQPTPYLKHFRAINPNAKLVWRNHIDTNGSLMADPSTPQGEVANYILDNGVREADAVITHPVESFVHPELSDRTFFAPATTEPHDDLNRPLSEREVEDGLAFINVEITKQNIRFAAEEGRDADIQPLLDPNKRRITLVARFDESKGMDHAMELGVRVRRMLREYGTPEADIPEVVIVGNGSVDDPSGARMYEEMLKLRRERYSDEKDGITLMRLRHNYAAMNALMYCSDIALQTSEAEGCETRISDWIEHGVPAFVFNIGGMPGQVVDGESGCILDYSKPGHDLERGAGIITELLLNNAAYSTLRASTRKQAEVYNRREYTTTANVTRFLRVFGHVLGNTPDMMSADRVWKVSDLAQAA